MINWLVEYTFIVEENGSEREWKVVHRLIEYNVEVDGGERGGKMIHRMIKLTHR